MSEEFTIKISKHPTLPDDWNFEVFQGDKSISGGTTELGVFGEVLESMILAPYLDPDTRERIQQRLAAMIEPPYEDAPCPLPLK